MSESLLPFYNAELEALRKLAGDFAEAHPKVAGRLRVTRDGAADDPHVERLLEGVAFLAARVQHRLEDELPEFSDALIELLSPHLLAPVPSMTTLRFTGSPDATGPTQVPRGLAVETDPVAGGQGLRYVTCHALTLWPVRIEAARLMGLPFAAPANPRAPRAAACLRLTLRTSAPDLDFAKTGLDRLRFHLPGSGPTALALHELLSTATIGIALADGPADPNPTLLPPTALRPAGFLREEAALPWPRRAFDGHRLLTEYFAFPEKFLYLDLDGLEARTALQKSDRLEIFFYLNRAASALERAVGAETLALHCTPAVNLFPQRCEPISLDGTKSDWLVLPDARRPAALEVHSIRQLRETRSDGLRRIVQPFHRLAREPNGQEVAEAEVQWIARRLPAPSPLTGTETRLMLRDHRFDPMMPADGVLTVEALCLNRDLPDLLPFGNGEPRLRIVDPINVQSVEAIRAPTSTLRFRLRGKGGWRLISHLALNHLGVMGGEDAALALREQLRLHDLRDAPETRTAIAALLSVDAKPGLARIPGQRPGIFTRGIDVTLTFDPQDWVSGGLYLLAAVLEHFLALQISVNGFVRTRAVLRGRTESVAQWPPRSGTRILL
ncbi:type VI secretion system baseplate subunit TssF [Muricoccus radiodurans]|uniref:type VI secretion system baseplate subunit TssF n=1 Tax=Muricoccus radiodurans TaxID=2231721 RepID=UPI003CEF5C1C